MLTSINGAVVAPFPIVTRPVLSDVIRAAVDALHGPDEVWARAHGLTVARVGTGREYRSNLFDTLGVSR